MTHTRLVIVILLLTSSFAFGQIKSQDIKIDSKITGFKFAKDMDGMLVYLPNGQDDFERNENPSSFSIHTEPDMTYDRSVGYIDYQMDYAKRHGSTLTNIIKKDTRINGYKAYEVTFTENVTGLNSKRLNYYSFFLKGSTAVIFLSGDSDNGKYIQKFKDTFRRAKI